MAIDYKDTLNLPSTDFAMKAGLSAREPQFIAQWNQLNIYRQLREQRRASKKGRFVLHDGPPYANGEIHIGHAVNKILKDIIVKAKGLEGFDAPYVPGWDCHGLPIELQVEKKVGKAGHKVDARAFRNACRSYAAEQVNKQREDFIRLGVIGDWQHPYLTMDYRTEADIVRALGRIIDNGHLHQGSKPVHWCCDCGSALAEAEVEYEERSSPAIDVRFAVLDDEALLARCAHVHEHPGHGPVSVVIWTTTPWTLPANQAVALNPGFSYAVVQCDNERLIIADKLLKDVMGRCGVEDYRVIAYCDGRDLEGLKLQHPFYRREVPIIVGEHVTAEAGTGAVHTAPGHGQEDYVVGQRYGLAVDNPVDDRGCFVAATELFAGEHVFAANDHVIEVLKGRGALLHHQALRHSYPHCWRHKTPIIFRATPQWFVSMEQKQLRKQALQAIEGVAWTPEWGQARIRGMIDNRPDWCISRQRTWGVPIPLFVHKVTGALHPRTDELIEQVALRIEQGGIDAWFELKIEELLGAEAEQYRKVNDTLDVWFDSGVTHYAVLAQRDDLGKTGIADLYLEGSDQHRGWFQSSLLTAVAMQGRAPYRQVLTHGFTVDAKGRKMSKSLGNVIAPQKVVNALGADILRLWVSATDYRGEMSVSDEILKRMSDAYRRIRNTARFLLANLNGFDPQHNQLAPGQMLPLDRWVVRRAAQLQDRLRQAYDSYEFHRVYQEVHNFCAIDLGGFYLDVIKDRQYTTQADSPARRSAQTALYHIVEALARWVMPILSFTAEDIWQHIPGKRGPSVLLEEWYDLDRFTVLPSSPDSTPMNDHFWQRVLAVRDGVKQQLELLRVAGHIGSSLDAEVDLYCSDDLLQALSKLGDELRFVLITSYARVHPLAQRSDDAIEAAIEDPAVPVATLWIRARASAHAKCVRCWHHREDVGSHHQHPELCGRCVDNVEGAGEQRHYA
ncbi:MAG: isoleucine--tRNA ligase [Gammaproteobacteria bacterium]|nr:isoleucine--tRNA ligase [Gammaproteobacteria bacterium]